MTSTCQIAEPWNQVLRITSLDTYLMQLTCLLTQMLSLLLHHKACCLLIHLLWAALCLPCYSSVRCSSAARYAILFTLSTCRMSPAALGEHAGTTTNAILNMAATCCAQPHAFLSYILSSTPLHLLQVDVCCFDKTGTLTSDNMVLEGVAGLPGRGSELVADVQQAGPAAIRVLACCHSLIHVDGDLVGDPLEKAAFTATGGQQ